MILPIDSNWLNCMAYAPKDTVMVVHDGHMYCCCCCVSMYPLYYCHRQCYHWHLANPYRSVVLDCNVVVRERVLGMFVVYFIIVFRLFVGKVGGGNRFIFLLV